MKFQKNQNSGEQELVVSALVLAINSTVNMTKNNLDGIPKPYQFLTVEIDYGNGTKREEDASVWTKSLEKNEDAFAIGKPIEVACAIEGEYAGLWHSQLPSRTRADLHTLLANMNSTVHLFKSEESIIQSNVIPESQVVI